MALSIDLGALPNYAASLLMIALAVLLLVIDTKGKVNRAFAAFLIARGINLSAATAAAGLSAARHPAMHTVTAIANVAFVATAATLLYFIATYPHSSGLVARNRIAFWALAITAGLVMLAVAFQPCLVVCEGPDGFENYGPLVTLHASLLLGLAAFSFGLDRRSTPEGPRRSALAWVAVAFAANAIYDGSRSLTSLVGVMAGDGIGALTTNVHVSAFFWLLITAPIIALVPAAAALVLLRENIERPLAAAAFVAVFTGVFVGATQGFAIQGIALLIQGFWRLAIPLVVGFAILRYQVVDFDVKTRRTVGSGAVVILVLGTFGLVTEITSEYLNQSVGLAVGGLAAAALFLVQGHVTRGAKHMANKIVPFDTPREVDESFCIAVEMALADGAITRAEERHLAVLVDRLGLDTAHAWDLRAKVEDRLAAEISRPDAIPA